MSWAWVDLASSSYTQMPHQSTSAQPHSQPSTCLAGPGMGIPAPQGSDCKAGELQVSRTGRKSRSSWCCWLSRALSPWREEIQPQGLLLLFPKPQPYCEPRGWSGRQLQALCNTNTGKTSLAGEGPRQGQALRGLEQAKVGSGVTLEPHLRQSVKWKFLLTPLFGATWTF